MTHSTFTIGRLARAAGVGIETIRYYQRRKLLPLPNPKIGSFRDYPPAQVDRIRFIKRSQELGFSLDEISTLLQFEDGMNRRAIRAVAGAHLDEVRSKIADLQRIEHALGGLIRSCAATGHAQPCPIIAALAGCVQVSPPQKRRFPSAKAESLAAKRSRRLPAPAASKRVSARDATQPE